MSNKHKKSLQYTRVIDPYCPIHSYLYKTGGIQILPKNYIRYVPIQYVETNKNGRKKQGGSVVDWVKKHIIDDRNLVKEGGPCHSKANISNCMSGLTCDNGVCKPK